MVGDKCKLYLVPVLDFKFYCFGIKSEIQWQKIQFVVDWSGCMDLSLLYILYDLIPT